MPTVSLSSDDAYERFISPHLDAAFNLARWLSKYDDDASDIVQEACLRALRYSSNADYENSRAWFLSIVRNVAFTMLARRRRGPASVSLDDAGFDLPSNDESPERLVLRDIDVALLRAAIEELSDEFREVIVLRELEELSYEEIAEALDIPEKTVMSRLARARSRLQQRLTHNRQGLPHGL